MIRGLWISILLGLFGLTPLCYATVSLSVNPVDGSNGLRFENMTMAGQEDKKEIHIRVNSNNGGRFQVFQRMLEPLVNEKGDVLNLQSIETQTLPNSNSSGTLYLQNSDHMSISDQLLYSSSQTGESDSFIIGYALNRSLINASGSFRGRLVFTVRGMGSNSTDEMTIDVFLEASSNFKISLKGAHQLTGIHIQSSSTSEKSADYLSVSFTGNPNQEIRIYQEIDNLPQNETDDQLQDGLLQLDAQGDSEGLKIAGTNPLKSTRSLIYESNKSEDTFFIYFLVNADQLGLQMAGTYRGKVKYVVETNQGIQEFPIDLQCDISPVFSMNVTVPPGGVNFSHVLPNSPPQDEEVLVTVISNLHKPYQVSENLQAVLTNQEGKEFDVKHFMLQVQIPSGQNGQSNFVEFSPVQAGEYPVFSSDSNGSGAIFKVVYRLEGYNQMSPGNFLVPIRFSLDQK